MKVHLFQITSSTKVQSLRKHEDKNIEEKWSGFSNSASLTSTFTHVESQEIMATVAEWSDNLALSDKGLVS